MITETIDKIFSEVICSGFIYRVIHFSAIDIKNSRDKTITIKFNKTDENIYKSSMNGLKNTLEDVVSILKEAKEEK